MKKLVALVCVVAWAAFWSFGYLALSAEPGETAQITTALIIAAVGFFTGMIAWLKLCRDCELPRALGGSREVPRA